MPSESGISTQGDLHTISCQGFVLKRAPEQKTLLRRHNSCEYPTILEPKPNRFKPQLPKSLTDDRFLGAQFHTRIRKQFMHYPVGVNRGYFKLCKPPPAGILLFRMAKVVICFETNKLFGSARLAKGYYLEELSNHCTFASGKGSMVKNSSWHQ